MGKNRNTDHAENKTPQQTRILEDSNSGSENKNGTFGTTELAYLALIQLKPPIEFGVGGRAVLRSRLNSAR